jgi:GSH-dependent disulfide-bond oxidoreductase
MATEPTAPSAELQWKPPQKVEELFISTSGNKFASINRPTAGAREQQDVPVGNASFQLYSLATPNGQKPGILLEELGIDYDAHRKRSHFPASRSTVTCPGIRLDGAQFTSGFVDINPNSKIPAAVDRDGPNGQPVKLFESGSLFIYVSPLISP